MNEPHQSPGPRPSDLRELPDDLTAHFRAAGIRLRPEVMYSGLKTEWVLVDQDRDGKCEMRTGFLSFDAGAPIAAIRQYLIGINAATELNEAARVAMFRPWWRGTTSEKDACEEYGAGSRPKAEKLLTAFRAYVPRIRPWQGRTHER